MKLILLVILPLTPVQGEGDAMLTKELDLNLICASKWHLN